MAPSIRDKLTYLNCKFDIVHVIGIMLSKFSLRTKKYSKYETKTTSYTHK